MVPKADAAVLARAKLFDGIGTEQLEALLAAASSRALCVGQVLFRQGGLPTRLYVLIAGRLKIARVTGDGVSLTVGYMLPGDIPGCVALFRQVPLPATATAVVDSRLLTWPAGQFMHLLRQDARIAANALDIAGARAEEMLRRMQDFATEPVEGRLAGALIRLAEQAGRTGPGGVEIDFPISRQDLAEMTGSTLYTVSRTLRDWERKGLVVSGRRRVAVRSLARLSELRDGIRRSRVREA